jgi:hypothetical protein
MFACKHGCKHGCNLDCEDPAAALILDWGQSLLASLRGKHTSIARAQNLPYAGQHRYGIYTATDHHNIVKRQSYSTHPPFPSAYIIDSRLHRAPAAAAAAAAACSFRHTLFTEASEAQTQLLLPIRMSSARLDTAGWKLLAYACLRGNVLQVVHVLQVVQDVQDGQGEPTFENTYTSLGRLGRST